MSNETNQPPGNDDTTIPGTLVHEITGDTTLTTSIDITDNWFQRSPKGSGPNVTHVPNEQPTQPLPNHMLALLQAGHDQRAQTLTERSVLGEGGMAIVYLADQEIPPRQVAVKRLRTNTAKRAEQLFAEALLTGSLEHPNIIPVHSIRIDPVRGPEVVLRRVDGISLFDAYRTDGQSEAGLRRLLPKLIQVCNALEYAHARGVIHRDIKPENIMLGHYGEVYLLDWGIAIDTTKTPPDDYIPVGTPHYLAPEMLSGNPDEVDARTDVYLVGATLHYLLVGEARHEATTTLAAALKAQSSESYNYPPHVFSELGKLANQACALAPSDRPQSIAELRQAIESCLLHWDAMRTVNSAHQDFEGVMLPRDEDNLREIGQHFDSAVLKYKAALASWPDCEEAMSRLQQSRLAMAEHYLRADDPRAATLVIEQLADVRSDDIINDRIAALRDRIAAADAQKVRMMRDAAESDITRSRTGRRRTAQAMLAVVAVAVGFTAIHQLTQNATRTAEQGLIVWCIGMCVMLAVLFINRQAMLGNEAGRRSLILLIAAPVLIACIRTVVFMHDLDPALIHPIESFAVAYVCATAVEVFPKGPQFAAVGVALGVAGLVMPTLSYAAFVCTLLLSCAGFVWQRLHLMQKAEDGPRTIR